MHLDGNYGAATAMTESPLLDSIKSPTDLKTLSEAELIKLSEELRQYLIQTLDRCGGHFAAGLGAVELTVALHAVFDAPSDQLLWDVGHQAYPHKILTGRKEDLASIRQTDGLAPFPSREESPYDAFGVGHSSTSIGAALGMALADRQLNRERRHHIAIIGDGGMTAGMAFEALNHAGAEKADLLVVLNDNDMSISRNVGALSNYFARIISSRIYTSMREGSKKILERVPPVWEFARRTEEHLKGMVAPGTLFEELGFNYFGPIDGHDVPNLVRTLNNVKKLSGPRLLHVITQKGKGLPEAEAAPIQYHAVSPGYLSKEAQPKSAAKKSPTYSEHFGDWLCHQAPTAPELVAITPAMREGSGLVAFSKAHPNQYVDVAIAEQHAVTLAAGMACEGLHPIVAIYSSFLQRAYDQLIHDVALQNLPVVFAIDRAGLVQDGPTHSGNYDISFLRTIPNVSILTPSSAKDQWHALNTAYQQATPVAVRWPRGAALNADETWDKTATWPWGKALVTREGESVALLAFGTLHAVALEMAETLDATCADMRFVKPLDTETLYHLAESHRLIVTLEDNAVMGGAGSAVMEALHSASLSTPVLSLGIPDALIPHGKPADMQEMAGLNPEALLRKIRLKMAETLSNPVQTPVSA